MKENRDALERQIQDIMKEADNEEKLMEGSHRLYKKLMLTLHDEVDKMPSVCPIELIGAMSLIIADVINVISKTCEWEGEEKKIKVKAVLDAMLYNTRLNLDL